MDNLEIGRINIKKSQKNRTKTGRKLRTKKHLIALDTWHIYRSSSDRLDFAGDQTGQIAQPLPTPSTRCINNPGDR
ncbi:MAG: hypothetical protein EA001_14420 [Oscillatoriales cyanobacterium]|nr:MAG: hypothetical protein EA001_14420 [Oscillatoriales cyanobacterium]